MRPPHPVGEDLIGGSGQLRGGLNVPVIPLIRTRAVICDLDGTLASCAWRREHLERDPVDWQSFHAGIPFDPLVPTVREWLIVSKAAGLKVLLVSGRPASWRVTLSTRDWLFKHQVPYDMLLMRAERDRRSDYAIKEELYRALIEPRFEIVAVCDDRRSVCEMWERLGLPLRRVTDPADRLPFTNSSMELPTN
jgi:hypothetical protein